MKKFPKGIHAVAIFFIVGSSLFYVGSEVYFKQWMSLIGIIILVIDVFVLLNTLNDLIKKK